MDSINNSLNDISYRQIIRKLTNGIDDINLTRGKENNSILVDSYINDQDDMHEAVINVINSTPIDDINHKAEYYDDDFDGNTWTRNDDGKWIPPKPNNNILHNLNCTTTPAQSDSGANRIVTDDIDQIINAKKITPVNMGGCNKEDDAAIVCTAMGTLPIQSTSGEEILVHAYYSAEVDGTIISPTTIVTQHKHRFSGWTQHSNCDNDSGYIMLLARDGNDIRMNLTCKNDLWYHTVNSVGKQSTPKITKLGNAARYELWHQRTAHAGQSVLETLHKHADGVPQLHGNSFYKCPSCMSGKLSTKRAIGKQPKGKHTKNTTTPDVSSSETNNVHLHNAQPGQHFHMDFGFVRGSNYNYKSETGSTVTSIDGKRAYLAIVDRATRYTWIFTTSSKHPPIESVKMILAKFKSTNTHRTVRVDQGGELGKSSKFLETVANEGFVVETTGSDGSAQNGMVERPNRTFGEMMRCLLHSAELGPEFWSFALIHAVYIKNRLPHQAIKQSPYQAFTGIKPDLSRLKIFGSRVYAKKPGRRPYKLDHHTATGYYLGSTATTKNILYIDKLSGRIKNATHVIFDEAHMTEKAAQAPLAAQTLQRLGYYAREDWIDDVVNTDLNQNTNLLIQQLAPDAKVPDRSTSGSIGYDIYHHSKQDVVLAPGQMKALSTGIALKCPSGTYARIAPRSGLTFKNNITTMAGVIDPDYRGELKILLHNFGSTSQTLEHGQRIAQMILERAYVANIDIVQELDDTTRGQNGFGSTEANATQDNEVTITDSHPNVDKHNPNPNQEILISKKLPPTPITSPLLHNHQDQYQFDLTTATTAAAAKLDANIQVTFDMPYDIRLSNDPFDFRTHRIVPIKPSDTDAQLGMILRQCPNKHLPQFLDCKKGSSMMRVQRWRSELRNGYITHINDNEINSIDDIKNHINDHRKQGHDSIKIHFATMERQAMHPQFGIPQLYHDQLNIIGEHLWEIKNNPDWNKTIQEELVADIDESKAKRIYPNYNKKKIGINKLYGNMSILPTWVKIKAIKKKKKLTRRILLKQEDWNDWKLSEHKQLNQYYDQGTFSPPMQRPKDKCNVLPLLWTYLIKDCGTKKARCVCNGSSKQKGTVTLGDTYAGSLEQNGSRIFWAATALNNYITIGADASNAFAEAPAPKAPLFVTIDQQYREWYQTKFPDKPEIPKDYVLRVFGALQGHPESARLWAILIDKIIRNLQLKPCTHEPCLYFSNNYNNTAKMVLFLRQVDDFAISCEDTATALDVIDKINSKMTIVVKQLGLIDRFNGVDIMQSRNFIKLYNRTYIEKILIRHDWIHNEKQYQHSFPTPMLSDNDYQRKLETQPTPTEKEIKQMESNMGFGYRQAIGELIYAMVTCRPDISYSVIKLSQYSTRPTQIHFDAIKNIYRYLNKTKDEGIHYWRQTPRDDLPLIKNPECKLDNNYDERSITTREQTQKDILIGAVDSDYAGDTTHRRSVSGIILTLAGGTILYKSKFQETRAMSSTEAEFTAAAEAGKYILYVRSILEQIGIPQHHATILYEDNQGALLMANAQQPTKRTRHMDIKHFVIQDWVLLDLIRLERISTGDNYADVMTKATGRTIFYRHMNFILGKIPPKYTGLPIGRISDYPQNPTIKKTITRFEHGRVLYGPPEVRYIRRLIPNSDIK
jgi:deoxyuridine 5'-triphosphate nucleotidohydrolase